MGHKSDKKSKKRKRERESLSHDSTSHTGDDSPRPEERYRNEKKEKKSKERKQAKRKKDKETEALMKEAKKFLKQRLRQGGEAAVQDNQAAAPLKFDAITADDYFVKNQEFTTWLREAERVSFNDLTTEESHELFDKFVEAWNGGKLAVKFYAGLAASTRRSTHNWGFKGEPSRTDGVLGMAAALHDELEVRHEQKDREKAHMKIEQQRWKHEQREALDEMLPKASGREGRIDAKMAKRETAKEREASPDIVHVPGGGNMFGGDDSFQAAKEREEKRQLWQRKVQLANAEKIQHKVSALQAAEDSKMAAFRALAAQGPIQIQKRV